MTEPHRPDRSPADRARILDRWQQASIWVGGQWLELRRIERATGPSHRDAAIRHRFDHDDTGHPEGETR